MATDKPRLSISMDEKTYEKVLAYKEGKGIATQSKAIIEIMGMGLDKIEREIAQKKSPSAAEAAPGEDVRNIFDKLNDLLVSEGFIKEDEDLTDRQADVILAICRIINATF